MSAEGKWRPTGEKYPWRDITDTSPLALPPAETKQVCLLSFIELYCASWGAEHNWNKSIA